VSTVLVHILAME